MELIFIFVVSLLPFLASFLQMTKEVNIAKISFNFERDQKQCQTETVVIGVSSFFLVQIIGVAQA